jgi:1-acyl-sn-glycerol-3-phosphate acyltransferase
MEGRLPLTPVLIFGAHRVMARDHTIPMWSRWQETVHVQVLAPIPTVDWDLERRPELQERTRRMMNDAYLKKMKDTRG